VYTRCAWLASKIENGLDYRPELEIALLHMLFVEQLREI